MSSQICRSASRVARTLLSASKHSRFYSEGRAAAAAAAVTIAGKSSILSSSFARAGSENASRGWITGALALPAAGFPTELVQLLPTVFFAVLLLCQSNCAPSGKVLLRHSEN